MANIHLRVPQNISLRKKRALMSMGKNEPPFEAGAIVPPVLLI
jgi:hypothetical protein